MRRRVKRADALVDLKLADPTIREQAHLIDLIKKNVRRCLGNPLLRPIGFAHPPLYNKFRGPLYPLKCATRTPSWRFLSPWTKAQIALLCLGESQYEHFQIHFHDDMLEELILHGVDLREYLRDRMSRCLKERFGFVPQFYFVIENKTASGATITRAHVHGAIQIPSCSLPRKRNGELTKGAARALRRYGRPKAQQIWGRKKVEEALRVASGNDGRRRQVVNGRDQGRNFWMDEPYRPLFNTQSVDYAFKNALAPSTLLGPKRLAMSLSLNQEAHRLWRLITEGESAMALW